MRASYSGTQTAADQQPERGLDAMLGEIAALQALTTTWPDAHRQGADALTKAVEALNAEAFRRLIRCVKLDAGTADGLRVAAADEVVYTVLRRHGIVRPSLFERVQAALNEIRPTLAAHGGNVELVAVDPPVVEVRFLGTCDGCAASAMTFHAGVRKAIQDNVPEITEIRQIKGTAASRPEEGRPQAGFVASPFIASADDNWRLAVHLPDLADGTTQIINLDGRSVLLSRFGDKLTCFENACAHMGVAMTGGEFRDGRVTCPYHGFEYALDSGECLTAPEVQLQPHRVRVAGERVEVQLSAS